VVGVVYTWVDDGPPSPVGVDVTRGGVYETRWSVSVVVQGVRGGVSVLLKWTAPHVSGHPDSTHARHCDSRRGGEATSTGYRRSSVASRLLLGRSRCQWPCFSALALLPFKLTQFHLKLFDSISFLI